MEEFARLFKAVDETTKTSQKVSALVQYFANCDARDAAWAVYFLTGRKIRQLVPSQKLRAALRVKTGIPQWLFDEAYEVVGDLAETIALLADNATNQNAQTPPSRSSLSLTCWVEDRLLGLKKLDELEQQSKLIEYWDELNITEKFIFTKLITGNFRVGASQQLVVKALSQLTGVSEDSITHRLAGEWSPTCDFYRALIHQDTKDSDKSRPYPFYLAYPLEVDYDQYSKQENFFDWSIEWKWDGIRSQLIARDGESFLWSRGGELISSGFPEIMEASKYLPDGTVLDGEILAWANGDAMPFQFLQKRITRKSVTKKMLAEIPGALMAYDLLEWQGVDIRSEPFSQRRKLLEKLIDTIKMENPNSVLMVSPIVPADSWQDLLSKREDSRKLKVEGLMLKRASSAYGVGRRKGDWWKWKIDPYLVDAVLIAAQPGHGRRASLYTDYTFGVWQNEDLIPVAKAYSGLDDSEIRKVDAFVRKNTLGRFGPVRTVKPELVFELAFEGIQASSRHKSGIAMRFPRIARWRMDKPASEADRLETLQNLANS
ncbi:MAG: ATP-dependent DNA ligase [Cyanobacteria bacterium TGS_CYA1]|nr:ATP-dependent DNA ligase [Cyanobacteria bacterium TGS_CYA1]